MTEADRQALQGSDQTITDAVEILGIQDMTNADNIE